MVEGPSAPAEVQLHGGLLADAAEGHDASFANLRLRLPAERGLGVVADLKWALSTRTKVLVHHGDLVRAQGRAHTMQGRLAMGWRSTVFDAIAGLELSSTRVLPYLRAVARVPDTVLAVRLGVLDGGQWSQSGDLAHLGFGVALHRLGVSGEVDGTAVLRPEGTIVPELALSTWVKDQTVRLTIAGRLFAPSVVVAVAFLPWQSKNRALRLFAAREVPDYQADATRRHTSRVVPRFIHTAPIGELPRSAKLDLEAAFQKDRAFTWTLTGMARPLHRCWVVEHHPLQTADARLALLRLVCTDDADPADIAGPDGPVLLRTGCHVIDDAGLWRLPACPGAPPREPNQRPVLLLPLRIGVPGTDAWFIQVGPRFLFDRSFTVAGEAVRARCSEQFLPGIAQSCASPTLGWMWSRTVDGRTAALSATATEPLGEPQTLERFSGPDVACRLHSACAVFGHCQPLDDHCVALRDADCAPAAICQLAGQCAAEAGGCVARSVQACAKTPLCDERGRCTPQGGRRVAESSAWCASTAACLAHGRCSKLGPECAVATDADCQRHAGCFSEGRCGKVANTCQAVSDQHCAASAACSNERRCVAVGGSCVVEAGAP